MRFNNKIVIISGGGAGMGKATALAFAKEGAAVVIFDISETNLRKASEEIRNWGGIVTAIQGDVTNNEDIQVAVSGTLKQYGQIDILFNYAGGNVDKMPRSLYINQTADFLIKMINLNLVSTMLFSYAVLGNMIQRKSGKIINTSAVAGLVGAPTVVAYSAAKGGIIAFTKALAREVAPYQINVNCICPGPVDTPGFAIMSPGKERKSAAVSVPLNRIGNPEEIAQAVLFLASDEASFITGHSLPLDGGMTMI